MKTIIHGYFRDVSIPIHAKFLRGTGVPEDVGGTEHSHDFTELVIFHGGRGVHRVEGQDYPVVAGNVFVVTGDQTHACVRRHDLQYAEVTFNARRVPLPAEHLRKLPGYHALFVLEPRRREQGRFRGQLRLPPTRLAAAVGLVHHMHRELRDRSAGYEAVLLARLIELIVFLSREYSRTGPAEGVSLLHVAEVVSELERDFARPWRLEELCEIAHMSKSALMTAFREATGQTPIDYLIHVRLRRAMELLRNTDDQVTRIALEVGFTDSNYLARKFREVLGTSPRAYRLSPR